MFKFYPAIITRSQKLFWNLILLVTALSVYGMFSKLIPSESYMVLMEKIVLILSLLIFSIFLFQVFKKHDGVKEVQKKGGKKVWINYISLFILTYIFLYLSIIYATPSIIHKFNHTKTVQTYEISSKGKNYAVHRGCNGQVRLTGRPYLKRKLCNIPELLWRTLDEGDLIRVNGTISYFGFVPKYIN